MVLGCTQPSADAYLAVPRSPAILFFDRGDYTRHRFTAFFFHFSFVVVYISVLGNAHECCTDAHNITTAMRNLIKSLLRTRHHQKCPSSLSALEYNNLDCCVCVFVFSFQKHNNNNNNDNYQIFFCSFLLINKKKQYTEYLNRKWVCVCVDSYNIMWTGVFMFFNDRIFVFLGISQSIGVEVCLMFSLKKKEERERSLQKNRNDYVCFFFFSNYVWNDLYRVLFPFLWRIVTKNS